MLHHPWSKILIFHAKCAISFLVRFSQSRISHTPLNVNRLKSCSLNLLDILIGQLRLKSAAHFLTVDDMADYLRIFKFMVAGYPNILISTKYSHPFTERYLYKQGEA